MKIGVDGGKGVYALVPCRVLSTAMIGQCPLSLHPPQLPIGLVSSSPCRRAFQGIDVARHLPHDALGNLMDLSMRTGVQLSTVYVSHISPFSATLMAKVPQRDSETAAAESAAAQQQLPSLPEDAVAAGTNTEEAWFDAGAAVTAAAAAAAPPTPPASADDGGGVPETPVSPSVPGTTMGSGFGRPRLGLSKIAETGNSFEALGLALRYPSSRIFVRAELLAPTAEGGEAMGRKDSSSASSFESGDLAELYPNLLKLTDAKERRSASERMDSQFEMQKIRQQLESAVRVIVCCSQAPYCTAMSVRGAVHWRAREIMPRSDVLSKCQQRA